MTQAAQSLIHLSSVSKIFETDELETHALSEVDLEIRSGEWVSVSGPSGCGKTTLLSILGLLDSPSRGTYALDQQPVAGLSPAQRARVRSKQIGFIFQSFNLIGDLNVYDNVELPLTYQGVPARERREKVESALERVQMAHRAKHMPSQLSGASSSALR